ncbi:glycosyltransferase family 4 protein [Salinicoccus sesuvii]|uniref:Glycosyltransferase family 4 protein n=1 Tax=Salinicoccus sesuvii TaxID=868281 RepID=A0ABV7N9G7_9STAP
MAKQTSKILLCSVLAEAIYISRGELVDKFLSKGFDIILVAPEEESTIPFDLINNNSVKYYRINLQRTGMNPFRDISTINQIKSIIRKEKPSHVYSFGGAKAAIYTSLAGAKGSVRNNYCMINGLGSIFRGEGIKNKLTRKVMSALFKRALNKSDGVIFQNEDDRQEFINKSLVVKDKTHIVNGSGVNLDIFTYTSIENFNSFLFVGRLLKDKGIYEYVEAARILKKTYPNTSFSIVGGFDDNPTGVSEAEINEWIEEGIITFHGKQKNVLPYYQECTAFVLPSYHEGTPRTSLEAMSVGRSIITTDAPGCRETVVEGVNGYLVPVKNVTVLVKRIEAIIKSPKLAQTMGYESFKLAKEKYDVHKVNESILKIIL